MAEGDLARKLLKDGAKYVMSKAGRESSPGEEKNTGNASSQSPEKKSSAGTDSFSGDSRPSDGIEVVEVEERRPAAGGKAGGSDQPSTRAESTPKTPKNIEAALVSSPKEPEGYTGPNPENSETPDEAERSLDVSKNPDAPVTAPPNWKNQLRNGIISTPGGAQEKDSAKPNGGEKGINGPQPSSKFRKDKDGATPPNKPEGAENGEKTAAQKAKGKLGEKAGKEAGAAAGAAIGSMLAPGAGSAIGRKVGGAVGKIGGKYVGENGLKNSAKKSLKGAKKYAKDAVKPGGKAKVIAQTGKKLLKGSGEKKTSTSGSLLGSDINKNSGGRKPQEKDNDSPKKSGGGLGAAALFGGGFVGITTTISMVATTTTTSLVGGTAGAILGGAASVAAIASCYDSRDQAAGGEDDGSGTRRRIGGAQLGRIVIPASGVVTSGYGERWGAFHDAVDIAGPIGTPIYAMNDGTVVAAGPAQGYGNWVIVENKETGLTSRYGHIVSYSVQVGDEVAAGDEIAKMGSEGFSTGPHLDLGVMLDGMGSARVDPVQFFRDQGIDFPGEGQGSVVALTDKNGAPAGGDPVTGDTGDGDQDGSSNSPRRGENSPSTSGRNSNSGDLSADGKTLDSSQSASARQIVNAAYEAAKSTTGETSPGDTDQNHVKVEDWKKVSDNDLKKLFPGKSWEENGGKEYAPSPDDASDEERMEVANRMLKKDGWGAWGDLPKAVDLKEGGPEAAPDGFFLDGGTGNGNGTEADGTPRKNDPDGKKAAVVAIMAAYTDTELSKKPEEGIFGLKDGSVVPEGDREDVSKAATAYAKAIVDRDMMGEDEGVIAEKLSGNSNADSYKANLKFAREIVDKILSAAAGDTNLASSDSCSCAETSPSDVDGTGQAGGGGGGGSENAGDLGDDNFDPNGGPDDNGPWTNRRSKGDPWQPSHDGSNIPSSAIPTTNSSGQAQIGLNNLTKHQRRVISTIVKVGQDKGMSEAAIVSAIMTTGMETKWIIYGGQDPHFDNDDPAMYESVYCDSARASSSHLPASRFGHSSAIGPFQQLFSGDGWRNRRAGSGAGGFVNACEFIDPANQASSYYEAIFDIIPTDEYRSLSSDPNNSSDVAKISIRVQGTEPEAEHIYELYHPLALKIYNAFKNDARYWPEMGGAKATGPTEEQMLAGQKHNPTGDGGETTGGVSAGSSGSSSDPCPPTSGAGSQRSTSGELVSTEMGKRIIEAGRRHEGGTYVYGGGDKDGPTMGGFDCSGFVQYAVYQATGVITPRSTSGYEAAIGTIFEDIPHDEARPGDIYLAGSRGHTGIFLGYLEDGTPELLHAYQTGSPISQTRAWDAADGQYKILRVIKNGGEDKKDDNK